MKEILSNDPHFELLTSTQLVTAKVLARLWEKFNQAFISNRLTIFGKKLCSKCFGSLQPIRLLDTCLFSENISNAYEPWARSGRTVLANHLSLTRRAQPCNMIKMSMAMGSWNLKLSITKNSRTMYHVHVWSRLLTFLQQSCFMKL